MGVCAKELKKPFYVLAESFKFSRLFPLSQSDLPVEYKVRLIQLNINLLGSSALQYSSKDGHIRKEHPLVDYTPPAYITLLFTDLGILTPSAVSDELINLYL